MRASELVERLAAIHPPGPRVGIEQEFEVWRGEERIDFRELIHSLRIDGARLDPGDVNAYRLASGLALTCDEAEAELASPPITIRAGFAERAVAVAALARETLGGLLPADHVVRGYSTHVSVSWPGEPDAEAAERYARTYGPLFGLLIDRQDSLGVYVRPRPGRIELCGEFVEGERLGAVAAFAAGTVLAAARGKFPPEIALELLPGQERFGYRVHRQACGFDLYSAGRDAVVPLAGGANADLQSLLRTACETAKEALSLFGCADEALALGAIIAGVTPLGIEAGSKLAAPLAPAYRLNDRGFGLPPLPSLTPIIATWDFAVFETRGDERGRFLAVPAHSVAELYAALGDGQELQGLGEISAGPLEAHDQTAVPGVYSSLPADRADLLPPEIPVDGEPKARAGRGAKQPGRPGKREPGRIGKVLLPPPVGHAGPAQPTPPPPPLPRPTVEQPTEPPLLPPVAPPAPATPPRPVPPPSRPWTAIVVGAGVAAAAVAVIAGVIINQSGGSHEETPSPTATSTAGASPATETPKPSPLPSETPKPTSTASVTPRPSETPPTPAGAAATATATQFATETPQPSSTPSATPTPTATATNTPTSTPTPTRTPTPTIRPTETPRPTNTPTPTPTKFIDPTPVPTVVPTCVGPACI